MAHLGVDLTAYVDGQLPDAAARVVDAHLEQCDDCAQAVRQQRLLKSRISTVSAPQPSPALLAALSGLPADPAPLTWSERVRRVAPVPAVLALAGASIAVAVVAYVVGAGVGVDRIRPPVEEYAAEFFGATTTAVSAGYSDAAVEELNEQGWSCADSLAGDLHRTTTGYDTVDGVVTVSYTNGTERLRLYEQPGTLDTSRLDGFVRTPLGGSDVWLSESDPTVATWDRDGVVYTVVTDVDRARLERALGDLPAPEQVTSWERVGDGLERMTAWANPAA